MDKERDLSLVNELIKIADDVIARRVDDIWEYAIPHLKKAASQGKYVAILKFNAEEFSINDNVIKALNNKCKHHGIVLNVDAVYDNDCRIVAYNLGFVFKVVGK